MDSKKIKIIIISAAALVVLVIIAMIIFSGKDNGLVKINDSIAPALEEEIEKNPIENAIGEINNISANSIEATLETGEKIILNIPKTGVSFIKQTEKDNKIIAEEIGLFEIPKNQKVDIQYNKQTKEIMMVIVEVK